MNTICCGIVVVYDGKFLLLRSYNYYEPPKGHLMPNETNLQAALRETKEEAGIKLEDLTFKWGHDYYETNPPYGRENKVVRFFVAESKTDRVILKVNPELGKTEHDGYRWLSYEEASKKVGARIQGVLDWAKEKIDGKQDK